MEENEKAEVDLMAYDARAGRTEHKVKIRGKRDPVWRDSEAQCLHVYLFSFSPL